MARFRREPSRNRGGNGPKRNPHDIQGLSFLFYQECDYLIILGCELLKRKQSSTIMAKTNFKTIKWSRFRWVEKYPQLQESWAGPHTREGWKGGNGKSPTEPQSGENLQNPDRVGVVEPGWRAFRNACLHCAPRRCSPDLLRHWKEYSAYRCIAFANFLFMVAVAVPKYWVYCW